MKLRNLISRNLDGMPFLGSAWAVPILIRIGLAMIYLAHRATVVSFTHERRFPTDLTYKELTA